MQRHTRGAITVNRAGRDEFEIFRQIDLAGSTNRDPGRDEFLRKAIDAGGCLLARDDGEPAGYAVFDQSFYGQAFIWLLVVRPERRRHGVATALVRQIEEICPTEKLFTSTNESNTVMQRFCDARGFVRSGVIENLDEGDPELVYFKLADRGARSPEAR